MKKPTQRGKVNMWAIECSIKGIVVVFPNKNKANDKRKFMNEEFKGTCTHKIVPVIITFPYKKI